MNDLWAQVIGAAVGAVISGLAGVGIALFAARLQKQEQAKVVRRTLAAELEHLLEAVDLLTGPETAHNPAAAIATFGTLRTPVYSGIVPQVGALGHELAADVIGLYTNFSHLIDRGQEVDDDLMRHHNSSGINEADKANATAWIGQVGKLRPEMVAILAKLRGAN